MEKVAKFLVKRRYIIFLIVLMITIFSGIMMSKVNIITDMTKFLPDDSVMKTGLDIMEEEFPETSLDNTISVMFTGIPDDKKESLKLELGNLKYVETVSYDVEDTHYNKDNKTLYVLNIPYDYATKEMDSVESAVKDSYSNQYDMIYSVDDVNGAELPLWIIGLALVLLMVILFIMSNSWVEPFLFIVTIGIAVVINMGTNAFLSGVSEKTYSVASILQLVLSMDYSIILMNRYRQELKLNDNHYEAMKKAIMGAFSSITSSAVTTIVGLLTLLFMSFKIGADMGIVLAKGVLISMICIFTILPTLILSFDKLIQKTSKKELPIKMDIIGRFSFKFRYVILGIFAVFFVGMIFTKGNTKIVYTMAKENKIYDVFHKENKIIMLYDNSDEAAIDQLITELKTNDGMEGIVTYANSIGKQYTADEMKNVIENMGSETLMDSKIELDSNMFDLIYYEYNKKGEIGNISLHDFIQFVQNDIMSNEMFSTEFDENSKAQLKMFSLFSSVEELNKSRSSAELGQIFNMDSTMIDSMLAMSGMSTMSIQQFLQMISTNPAIASSIASTNQEAALQMQQLQMIITDVMQEKTYSTTELAELFGKTSEAMNESTMKLLYTLYFSSYHSDSSWTMSMKELFDYTVNNMALNEQYARFFDKDTIEELNNAKGEIDKAIKMLKGEQHSLLIISTTLPVESKETNDFIEDIMAKCDKDFSSDYYLIGDSPFQYEISLTFHDEMNKITIFTAVAIFIVILITFQSFVIPLILVLTIQAAVYATVVIIGLQGFSINYIALLIVQSILMGATIDYGILFTSYYREKRKSMKIKDSLIGAYNGSIHTILTSGLIMVVVTGILGYAFDDPTIGQICYTISMGASCALILIVFVLPGILTVFDKLVCKNHC
ncbi:MAG TPA: MMPL family transporter [Lachnospiraceae bacterium]|nr:MMPL family transporter [Lachnospiraceae bacterium]